MPFLYKSGEQVMIGDRVLLGGNPGHVELIADPVEDPTDWYVTQFGGGIMVVEPKVFGRLFLTSVKMAEDHDRLVLVSRRPDQPAR